jgi:DNA-binding NtrC family response regulator
METFERFELLEQLVASIPATPIIVMTGPASVFTEAEALRKGAVPYLTKPFPIGDLRLTIGRALQQARTQCS